MATLLRVVAAGVMVFSAASASVAQVSASEAEQIHVRQQIATMEIVLTQAISHAAENVYAQVRSVVPDRPRFSERPRVSGFTLPGYGTVFTVDVPEIQLPILYDVLVREQQIRLATMDLQRMRAQLSGMPPGPQRDRQVDAISQLEQQLGLRATEVVRGGLNAGSLVPVVPVGIPGAGGSVDQKVVEDPETAYSREVKNLLLDAMLTNSQGLTIGADEWLTIVARNGVPTNPQTPGDSIDSRQGLIRVKGSVLAAFRAGTISKEEAIKQVEVKQQ
jgi:hypothetical protein